MCVSLLLTQARPCQWKTLWLVYFILPDSGEVRPAQHRNQPGGGEGPGQADHQQGPLLGPLPQVLQGGGDGPVSESEQHPQHYLRDG